MGKTKITTEQSLMAIKLIQDGMTYNYIAKKLNLTHGLVKNHLNRNGYFSINKKNKIINCLHCKSKVKQNDFVNGKRVVRSKFCNQSCSASYSNKIRVRNKKEVKECLNCKNNCGRSSTKYCSQICQSEYRNKILIENIKNKTTEKLSDSVLKRGLILFYGEKCMKCGWSQRNEKTNKVPVELNHKDGNSSNNSSENVELICPNCHSLTPNYRGLNKGNGRYNRRQRARDGKSY